jgi:hypothetical protein
MPDTVAHHLKSQRFNVSRAHSARGNKSFKAVLCISQKLKCSKFLGKINLSSSISTNLQSKPSKMKNNVEAEKQLLCTLQSPECFKSSGDSILLMGCVC